MHLFYLGHCIDAIVGTAAVALLIESCRERCRRSLAARVGTGRSGDGTQAPMQSAIALFIICSDTEIPPLYCVLDTLDNGILCYLVYFGMATPTAWTSVVHT
jgi:hypothetical protein